MGLSEFGRRATKAVAKSKDISEADVENPFVKYAKYRGCTAYKLRLIGLKGFPDRTVLCYGGRVFFVEFKKKGKKLSPTQLPIKHLLEKLGFKYYICDAIGQAEKHLDEVLGST